MQKVCIVGARRSAIGRFLGALRDADAVDVCAQVLRGGFDGALLRDVESVVLGNAISAGLGQGVARQIALRAGIPQDVPAYTVGMVCGSGMQAALCGMNEIRLGANLVLCGGFEFMSGVPYAAGAALRSGARFGDLTLTDLLVHDGLTDAFSGKHMGVTAENIARMCGIDRQEQDAYAYMATRRAIWAIDAGRFADEIVPVQLTDRRGKVTVFDTDEQPNRAGTPEKIAQLRPAFLEGGTVTAASSSGLNDGAAFLLLASEAYCKSHGIVPMAELVCGVAVGCDPQTMGLGSVYAVQKLLRQADMPFLGVGRFELNEAFAAQALGCVRMLAARYGVPEAELLARTNVYGSGLGLGHPLGATGARLMVTLSHMIARSETDTGVASLCVGGGMGLAVLLRRMDDAQKER